MLEGLQLSRHQLPKKRKIWSDMLKSKVQWATLLLIAVSIYLFFSPWHSFKCDNSRCSLRELNLASVFDFCSLLNLTDVSERNKKQGLVELVLCLGRMWSEPSGKTLQKKINLSQQVPQPPGIWHLHESEAAHGDGNNFLQFAILPATA